MVAGWLRSRGGGDFEGEENDDLSVELVILLIYKSRHKLFLKEKWRLLWTPRLLLILEWEVVWEELSWRGCNIRSDWI